MLFSQRSRLGPPAYPDSPHYPIAATTANSVNIFPQDRHLKTPRVHSYSAGVQRSIGRDMALEVRYVGNRNNNTWAEEDWNERSIFASGFYDEFLAAQRNITANVAAGLANRGFAYTGAPGTSPLPIHLAYLNGSADVNNPAAYAHTNFTNSDVHQPVQRAAAAGDRGVRTRSTPRSSGPMRSAPACRAT